MSEEKTPFSLEERMARVELRLDKGADTMRELRDDLADNTAKTDRVLDMMETAERGFRVLGWIGTGVKWLGGIAMAVSALWALLYQATHHGQLPK